MFEPYFTDEEKLELKAIEIALRGGDDAKLGRWCELFLNKMATPMGEKLRPRGEGYPYNAEELAAEGSFIAFTIGKELIAGSREEIARPECFVWKCMKNGMLDMLGEAWADHFEQLDPTQDEEMGWYASDDSLTDTQDRFEAEMIREDILTVCKNDTERALIDFITETPNVEKAAEQFGGDDRLIKYRLKSIGHRYGAKLVEEERAEPFGKEGRWPTKVKPDVPQDAVTLATPVPELAPIELELSLAT